MLWELAVSFVIIVYTEEDLEVRQLRRRAKQSLSFEKE